MNVHLHLVCSPFDINGGYACCGQFIPDILPDSQILVKPFLIVFFFIPAGVPGFDKTCPLSTSSFLVPLNKIPALSPALPSSNCLLNISIPVTTVFVVSLKPTISISSFKFNWPDLLLENRVKL